MAVDLNASWLAIESDGVVEESVLKASFRSRQPKPRINYNAKATRSPTDMIQQHPQRDTILLRHRLRIPILIDPLQNPHGLELRTISLNQISIVKRQSSLLDQIASLRCRQSFSCTMRSRKRCRGSCALWCQCPFSHWCAKRGFSHPCRRQQRHSQESCEDRP